MSPLRRCLYEELGITRNSDDAEIKRAYRVAALVHHPDKNRGGDEAAAEERFKAIQHAYEILSDPHERAWYDSHREAFLRGGDSFNSGNPNDASEFTTGTSVDLFSYFSSNAFSGFDQSENSFYSVYGSVFATLASEERVCGATVSSPTFGGPDTEWVQVRRFYQNWEGFCSRKEFGSADKWNLSEGPNRDYRRAMERENKRERAKAKKQFNMLVRELVAFVKKRDPRVKARKEAELEEKDLLAKQTKEREHADKLQREARAAEARAQRDEVLDEDGDALDEILAQMAIDEELDHDQRASAYRKKNLRESNLVGEGDQHASANTCMSEHAIECNGPMFNDSSEYVPRDGFLREDDVENFESLVADDDQDDENDEQFYCAACRKQFRSIAQKSNHESSKKHATMVKKLCDRLESEERLISLSVAAKSGTTTRNDSADEGGLRSKASAVAATYVSNKTKKKGRRKIVFPTATLGDDASDDVEDGVEGVLIDANNDDDDDDDKEEEDVLMNARPNKEDGESSRLQVNFQAQGSGLSSLSSHVQDKGSTDPNHGTAVELNAKTERRLKRREKKKQKEVGTKDYVTNALTCNVCKASFASRNKLMTHVREKGHALHV